MAFEDGSYFEDDYGIDAEWHLLSFEFLTQLYEFSQYLGGNATLSSLTTFWKYYGLVSKTAPFPKFISYVTHDEIMGAYFEALDWH